MSRLYHCYSDELVFLLHQAHEQGRMRREEVQDVLDIHCSRFFVLLRKYRIDPETFATNIRERPTEGSL
jgi:hypothetical protein